MICQFQVQWVEQKGLFHHDRVLMLLVGHMWHHETAQESLQMHGNRNAQQLLHVSVIYHVEGVMVGRLLTK